MGTDKPDEAILGAMREEKYATRYARERYASDPAFRRRKIEIAAAWQKRNRERAAEYVRKHRRKKREAKAAEAAGDE